MGAGGNSLGPLVHRIKKGLITKEDSRHFHKTLGVSVLLHFLYRFANVGPTKDMNFGSTRMTLASMGMHAMLSLSSLIFRIPTKRIAEGSRIWPEYRLHSIAFACRSLLCMLVTWSELRLGVSEPVYAANAAIVIGTMLAADFGSWWVGPNGRSSTIQELDAPPFMRFFFSVMQFHATAGCLLGVRRFSTQFFYVWVIQFTAFLMTLRRKNLAPHGPLVVTYGVMLAAGAAVSLYDHSSAGLFLAHNILAHTAVILRVGLRTPKYVLWGGLALVAYFGRATFQLSETSPVWPSLLLWLASTGGVLAVGARKLRSKAYGEANAKKAS